MALQRSSDEVLTLREIDCELLVGGSVGDRGVGCRRLGTRSLLPPGLFKQHWVISLTSESSREVTSHVVHVIDSENFG
jgi:hypothetical protein